MAALVSGAGVRESNAAGVRESNAAAGVRESNAAALRATLADGEPGRSKTADRAGAAADGTAAAAAAAAAAARGGSLFAGIITRDELEAVLEGAGIVTREQRLEAKSAAAQGFGKLVDLRPHCDRVPFIVHEMLPLRRAFRLFQTMGLRHLCVLNEASCIVGILTRKDFLNVHALGRSGMLSAIRRRRADLMRVLEEENRPEEKLNNKGGSERDTDKDDKEGGGGGGAGRRSFVFGRLNKNRRSHSWGSETSRRSSHRSDRAADSADGSAGASSSGSRRASTERSEGSERRRSTLRARDSRGPLSDGSDDEASKSARGSSLRLLRQRSQTAPVAPSPAAEPVSIDRKLSRCHAVPTAVGTQIVDSTTAPPTAPPTTPPNYRGSRRDGSFSKGKERRDGSFSAKDKRKDEQPARLHEQGTAASRARTDSSPTTYSPTSRRAGSPAGVASAAAPGAAPAGVAERPPMLLTELARNGY